MLGVFNCKQGHIIPKPNVKYAIVKAKRPVQTIIPHTLDQPTALHISLSELWLNPETWQALQGGTFHRYLKLVPATGRERYVP